jgi:cbb3-type cytochrome oxidase cytochrome c subunit
MNYGPIIFLVAFFALASSWFGLVLTPQVQLGRMQPTNNISDKAIYPVSRPGQARQGLDVYRANGCAYCHSQQVRQSGAVCEVWGTEPGTNQAAAIQALLQLRVAATEAEAGNLLTKLPERVRGGLTRYEADAALKALKDGGMKADMLIVPRGPDIKAGWGVRRSVAEDFLYDAPVMLGSQRIGPDLASAGMRLPDANWHFRHLYAPESEVKGSLMPPYRHLFEKKRVERVPSPDALALQGKRAPEPGFEIVPTTEAKALVSYLLSLRTDTPLFDAPFKVALAAPPPPPTNAAPGTATNAPSAGTPGAATNTPGTNPVSAPK